MNDGYYYYVDKCSFHDTHQKIVVISHTDHQSDYQKHNETNDYFPRYFVETFIHLLISLLFLSNPEVVVSVIVIYELDKQAAE